LARSVAGGIARAADLLAEHGGAIEADLQRYYGVHVGDFPTRLTARRLFTLLEHLPDDCALRRAGLDPADRHWTFEADLLATVIDEIRAQQYLSMRIAGQADVKPPKQIPRPGIGRATRATAEAKDRAIARVLSNHRIEPVEEWEGGS
jgi:hypothetical protein